MDFEEAWSDTCSSVGSAVRVGNVTALDRLINENFAVDIADNRGWKPLHEAAAVSPNIECLERLLKHDDTDINWTTHSGETALLLACKRRQGTDANEFIKLLLEHKADPNIRDDDEDSPLLEALYKNNIFVVEQLILAGVDVNAADCGLWTPLHEAAKKDDPAFVKLLLSRENICIDPRDECGLTPVFVASQHGQEVILRELLAAAEKKGQLSIINVGAKDLATPLMIAAQQGFVECARTLLDYGADPNLRTTDNATALHLAVQGGKEDCLKMIVKSMNIIPIIQHFDPKTFTDLEMICPLHLAIDWKQYECLKLLLSVGFSPDSLYKLEDSDGLFRLMQYEPKYESALCYAIGNLDQAAVDILIANGASCNPPIKEAIHPLLKAMRLPTPRIFQALVNNGGDVNFPTGNGLNVIFLYSLATGTPNFRWLLYHGCDPRMDFADEAVLQLVLTSVSVFLSLSRSSLRALVRLLMKFMVADAATRTLVQRLSESAEGADLGDIVEELRSPSTLKQICKVYLRHYVYSVHGVRLPRILSRLDLPKDVEEFVACNYLPPENV